MSAATTGSSRPGTPRPARRTPGAQWLPRQHGAWAMLLVPAVVGAVRGGFDGLQLVLAVGVLTAYGAVNAAGLAAIEATPPSNLAKYFGWYVGGTAVILGTLTIVFIVYSVIL